MRLATLFLVALIVFIEVPTAWASPQSCDFFKEKAEAALSDFGVGVYLSFEPGVRMIRSNGGGAPSDNDLIVGIVDCELDTDVVRDIMICTRMHYKTSSSAAVLGMLVGSLSTGIPLEKLTIAAADMAKNGISKTRRDSGFDYVFINWPEGSMGKNAQVCMSLEAAQGR